MINLEELKKLENNRIYKLRQLGTQCPQHLYFYDPFRHNPNGWHIDEVVSVIKLRTSYLNSIIPCEESQESIKLCNLILSKLPKNHENRSITVLDEGHIYQVRNSENKPLTQKMIFIKRSGGAIRYNEEWAGLQTQEVCRALIHLFMQNRCHWELADLTRQILWHYEARAYRRKLQEFNRASPIHKTTYFPYEWETIETWSIGEDGHIPFLESEILYYATYDVCDAETISSVDPFVLENNTHPAYQKAQLNLTKVV